MTFSHGTYSCHVSTGCRCVPCVTAYDWYLTSARGSAVSKVGADFPAVGVALWVGSVTA